MADQGRKPRRTVGADRPPEKTGPKDRRPRYTWDAARELLRRLAEVIAVTELEDAPGERARAFLAELTKLVDMYSCMPAEPPKSDEPGDLAQYRAACILYRVIDPKDLAVYADEHGQSVAEAKAEVTTQLQRLLPGFGSELLTPKSKSVLEVRGRSDASYARVGESLATKDGFNTVRKRLRPLGSIVKPDELVIEEYRVRAEQAEVSAAPCGPDGRELVSPLEVADLLVDVAAHAVGKTADERAQLAMVLMKEWPALEEARTGHLVSLLPKGEDHAPRPAHESEELANQ